MKRFACLQLLLRASWLDNTLLCTPRRREGVLQLRVQTVLSKRTKTALCRQQWRQHAIHGIVCDNYTGSQACRLSGRIPSRAGSGERNDVYPCMVLPSGSSPVPASLLRVPEDELQVLPRRALGTFNQVTINRQQEGVWNENKQLKDQVGNCSE